MDLRYFALCLIVSAVIGCDSAVQPPIAGPPPMGISIRKSQIPLQGLVLGITNNSSGELRGITVLVRSPGDLGERSHLIQSPVLPGDTITIGWVELDGWKLKTGDKVTIKCDEYKDAKELVVKKP